MGADQSIEAEFLVTFDYGQGDLWAFIAAPSAAAIRAKFPALNVFERAPDSISEVRFAEMKSGGPKRHGEFTDANFWLLKVLTRARDGKAE